MSYTVNTNTKNITVEYGTINTETSLQLVGKDYFGYGEAVAQNFASLLENFASGEPALADRIEGQMWYDATADILKVWDGTKWNGSTFNQSGITDTASGSHDVFLIEAIDSVTGLLEPVATFSQDNFTINASETIGASFPGSQIKAGITLATGMKMHGTATTAEYADLAEMYTSDVSYEPGTVVKIGGEAEVTQTTIAECPEVFGVVSTNPAYLMNSALAGTTVAVALEGRVPCKAIGEVRKGQRLVTSDEPGVARIVSDYEKEAGMDWFRVVGRALEDKDTLGIGLVEIVVGVK